MTDRQHGQLAGDVQLQMADLPPWAVQSDAEHSNVGAPEINLSTAGPSFSVHRDVPPRLSPEEHQFVKAAFGAVNRHLVSYLSEQCGIAGIECFLEGGCKTGHSRPIKPTSNPARLGQQYMEIDGSIGLPMDLNPHDERILTAIADGLAHAPGVKTVELGEKYTTDGWDKLAPQCILYVYLNVPGIRGREVEIEYCVQRLAERVDVADWWSDLFSPAEIVQQINERNAATCEDQRSAVKKRQCDDGRGRLLLLFHSGLSDMPEIPSHVMDLVGRWYDWLSPEAPPPEAYPWVREGWACGDKIRQEEAVQRRIEVA